MLGQMKDLMKLQQQAKQMKKKLKNLHIEAEVDGITVVMDANLEIVDIIISDDAWAKGKDHVQKSLIGAFEKAMKKAQEVAAQNMQDMMGGLGGLSEMLGGGSK